MGGEARGGGHQEVQRVSDKHRALHHRLGRHMITHDDHCPVSGPETEQLPQVDVLTSDQEPELQLVINTDTLQDIRQDH